MELNTIVLSEKDNVAVLTGHAQPGDLAVISTGLLPVRDSVPTGHKLAIRFIPAHGGIVKYGVVIGRAKQDILPGEWVHTHNVEDITEQLCNEYAVRYRAKAKEARTHGPHSGI